MFVFVGYAACRGVSEHIPSKDDIECPTRLPKPKLLRRPNCFHLSSVLTTYYEGVVD